MISICQQDAIKWKSQGKEESRFEEMFFPPKREKMSFY
jgi:hypothetical protein